uniref:NPH3 domain-containing protein n=1 Tax=Leersia perrieri TaxID=77586 RepID=A0A0D9X0Y9_9ORYZ
MEMSRSWQELGVVDTIYEDDHEEEEEEEEECFDSPTMSSSPAATSLSCSPPPFAMPPSLRDAVREWSRVNGPCKPDVIIRVQEHCFALHRDPITSKSSYLKRRLSESSDIAVDLPSGLTVDAFVDAVASCYAAAAEALSPATLAAAWAAAGWLELRAGEDDDDDGLARRAEDYFFQEVATDNGRAAAVLRSCTAFLGGEAAGAAASLLVRCLETLASSGGGGGGRWLDDVAALPVEEFEVVVEAMRARFAHDHDLMYTIVDHYLENHRGKLTEEEKSRVCYNVNCTKLSHHLFMHLVQNPRLPLRFVVQAMLVEQLHSHHSMLLSTTTAAHPHHAAAAGGNGMTLGDILQRDAVLRQSAHIRASMNATSQRIDCLERELAGLRTRLRRSEQQAAAAATASAAIDRASAKSASFRIPRSRLWDGEDIAAASGAAAIRKDVVMANGKGNNNNNNLRSRLVVGFKNLFGRRTVAGGGGESDNARVNNDKIMAADVDADANADEVVCKEERTRPHRRNLSMV